MKRVLYIAILAVMVMALTACGSKQSITAEDFALIMTGAGHSVEQGSIDEQASSVGNIAASYLVAYCGEFHIEFFVFETAETARSIYNNARTALENTRGGSHAYSSVGLANYNRYSQTTGGRYAVVSRIDTTLVIVVTSSDNRSDVNAALKLIGY
jgi:hypothetical protein